MYRLRMYLFHDYLVKLYLNSYIFFTIHKISASVYLIICIKCTSVKFGCLMLTFGVNWIYYYVYTLFSAQILFKTY